MLARGILFEWGKFYTVTSPADPTTGVFPRFMGHPNLKTETLLGFELGYRHHFLENFMADIASFVNFLDNTTSIEPAWKAKPNLEFAVVGRNLSKKHHPEFGSEFLGVQPTEIEQSVYGRITWRS